MLHAYLCAGDFELFTSFPICDRNVPILAPTCLLQKFNAQKQLLLLYETILLQTLGFHLNVVYPYTVSTARRKWTHMASYLFYSRPFIDCERKALGWTQVCIRYFLCLSSLYNRFEVKVAIRVVCISLGVCVCGCTMCVHVCGLARVPTAYRAHRYSANNECIQCDVNSHMNPYFFCSFCLHSWRAYSSLGEAQILYTKLPICQRPLWTTGKLALPIRHHQCSLGEYAQTASFKTDLCVRFSPRKIAATAVFMVRMALAPDFCFKCFISDHFVCHSGDAIVELVAAEKGDSQPQRCVLETILSIEEFRHRLHQFRLFWSL